MKHPNDPGRDDTSERPVPCAAPRLVTYGALADITRAVGPTSNMDGGSAAGMMMSQA